MDNLDQLVDVVAARIRAQLGQLPNVVSGSSCADNCTQCGHCTVKLAPQSRTLAAQGVARFAAAAGISTVDGGVATDLSAMIDHTLLKPDATLDELKTLCDEAKHYGFASVCVNSANVTRCRALLGKSSVMVCAVVGFPLGAMAPRAKAFEAREAVRQGASEIDMVINIGALKDGDYPLVAEDISGVVAAARPAKVKVIIESGMLTDEEKVIACTLSKLGGAHFVKTSTGFGKGGATSEDVALMRRVVGAQMGVKASGGVRSTADAKAMIASGATRIGASASVAIVTGRQGQSSY